MASVVAVALALGTLSFPAGAQRAHRAAPPQWHGNIERFHEHDWQLWRNGHWSRLRHGGRMGWWWVVGTNWYFYPTPVYPYPNPWEPPPVTLVNPPLNVSPPAPPATYWYYCEASHSYYPYVPECAGAWTQVPATPLSPPTD